jgi:hypothetical protein
MPDFWTPLAAVPIRKQEKERRNSGEETTDASHSVGISEFLI